jgi:hypothetical protein
MPMPGGASGLPTPTIVAVDWSGRQGLEQIHAIRAAVVRADAPAEVWSDLTRQDVIDSVLQLADEPMVVGFDFSFGFPSWVCACHALQSAPELWPLVATDGDRWLAERVPPFHGWAKGDRPREVELLRATERRVKAKSTLQANGAGTVGTGSIRGMPHLVTLRRAGFRVWPFEDAGPRTVVEIYPTVLRARVRAGDLPHHLRAAVANNDNTRDAVLSALAMWEHRDELMSLRATTDPVTRLEGEVWVPRR